MKSNTTITPLQTWEKMRMPNNPDGHTMGHTVKGHMYTSHTVEAEGQSGPRSVFSVHEIQSRCHAGDVGWVEGGSKSTCRLSRARGRRSARVVVHGVSPLSSFCRSTSASERNWPSSFVEVRV